MRTLSVVVALAAACGGGSVELESRPVHGSAAPPASGSSTCAGIAQQYHDAFVLAVQCNPSAANACTAWRPLTTLTVGADGAGTASGLCWVAGVGYIPAQNTAVVDGIIERYKAAGCALPSCPGPVPQPVMCKQGAFGSFTCGGM